MLAGYFAAAAPAAAAGANGAHLAALMMSSALLYVAGIVLNDYFDIETDRKERPGRPLPSGRISKRRAIAIAIIALVAGNALALAASPASFAVSLILTATVIAYDYRLKHGYFSGPLAMGGARFLNVILGASPALPLIAIGSAEMMTVLLAATSLFAYVAAITILSKKEVGNEKPNMAAAFSIVFAVIVSIALLGLFLLELQWAFLLNLSIFAGAMVATFKRYLASGSSSLSVQKAIRNMVISIIVLDSVFVSGAAGLPYGFATLLLIAPAVLLAKKLYVT